MTAAEGVRASYDAAGHMRELTVARPRCWEHVPSCSHRFLYDWDEQGQLARARRWDYPAGSVPPLGAGAPPAWDLRYAYSGGRRVVTSVKGQDGAERHTLAVFSTLRIQRAEYLAGAKDYAVTPQNEVRFVGGMARVFVDAERKLPLARQDGVPVHVLLALGDHLGSTAFVIDKDSGEVVERTTYQPFGAVEADFRPARWGAFREAYKFTGKEEDIEVGLTYFGARYYQAHLGQWMSADPLTIHGPGGDLNPYAYVGGQVMTSVDPLGLMLVKPPSAGPEKGSSRDHAEDMANRQPGEGSDSADIPEWVPTLLSDEPGAFRVHLNRIIRKVGRAFMNAGKDLGLGLLTHSPGITSFLIQVTGVLDPLKTPDSEKDATYYAAMGGLMVLGGELGAGPGRGAPAAEAPAAGGWRNFLPQAEARTAALRERFPHSNAVNVMQARGGPVHLYRAVSDAELADVAANGFRPGEGTMETKLFAKTPQHGGGFARLLHRLSGQSSTLLRVRIPTSVARQLEYFPVDGVTAVGVPPDVLPLFNEAAMIEEMTYIPSVRVPGMDP